jgi:hypothetical protein
MAILTQENLSFDDALDCIREDKKYETIRVEEPDLFTYKPLPLLQFIMPTFGRKTIMRHNKTIGLDKGTIEDFSLNKFLFSDNPQLTDHMMKTLKKRKVFLSLPRLK